MAFLCLLLLAALAETGAVECGVEPVRARSRVVAAPGGEYRAFAEIDLRPLWHREGAAVCEATWSVWVARGGAPARQIVLRRYTEDAVFTSVLEIGGFVRGELLLRTFRYSGIYDRRERVRLDLKTGRYRVNVLKPQ